MKFMWNLQISQRNYAEYVRVSANLHKTEIDWAMLGKLGYQCDEISLCNLKLHPNLINDTDVDVPIFVGYEAYVER